jgi:hypothetical protein
MLHSGGPKAAPGASVREEGRYAKARTSNLSGRCGTLFRWCHQHLSTALVSSGNDGTYLRSASIKASGTMIIPIMPTVNKWLAMATSNPAT